MAAAGASWLVTHLKSFGPLCWITWRLRWDLREKRRPQPSTGHWQGRCGHRDIAVRFHTRRPTLPNITPECFSLNVPLTAPVCTVSCSLSFHCLLKVAPQPLWLQLNSCIRGPPTPLLLPRTPFIVFIRELVFLLLLFRRLCVLMGEKAPLVSARLIDSRRLLIGWLAATRCPAESDGADCPAARLRCDKRLSQRQTSQDMLEDDRDARKRGVGV